MRTIFSNLNEWRLFGHVAIDHQPLTALEQWKASRHRLLWSIATWANGTLPLK